jgi:hypothetical protein
MIILAVAFVAVVRILVHIILSESEKQSNIHRHLTAEHPYGHFSEIDSGNYIVTPSLLFTSPHRFTMTAGDSLWIPKRWWHWIRTTGPSVAVSLWLTDDPTHSHKPLLLHHCPHPPELLPAIDSIAGTSQVWDTALDLMLPGSQLSGDNQYIITVKGYTAYNSRTSLNNHIRSIALKHATVPPGADLNVWISKGYNDTGLHYDEGGGLLTVLRGRKEVTLYPPSDTPLLRPRSLLPEWATQRAANVEYNFYKFHNVLPSTSLPSARLLYESTKNHAVLREISKMKYETSDPLVWGCKLEKGTMRWEVYAYHYDIYNTPSPNHELARFRGGAGGPTCIIHSIDLFDRPNPVGPDRHCYFKDSPGNEVPIWGRGTTGDTTPESVFYLDTASRARETIHTSAVALGFHPSDVARMGRLLDEYACRHIAVWNKYKRQVFIQYLGISVTDFIRFLRTHGYPSSLIDHVKNGGYDDIQHEITIVYDIKTLRAVRSGFYGIV